MTRLTPGDIAEKLLQIDKSARELRQRLCRRKDGLPARYAELERMRVAVSAAESVTLRAAEVAFVLGLLISIFGRKS
jgi:hypothetical protein